MVKILLTKGKSTIIDDDDFERISKYKCYFKDEGTGYAATTINYKTVRLHRIIMNAPKNMEVDHINKNTLDNRKVNLRLCTKQQNQYNAKIRKDNISGYKGVNYKTQNKKWRAYVRKDGKHCHLGYFNTKEEAARAYNKVASYLYGEFACLNKML